MRKRISRDTKRELKRKIEKLRKEDIYDRREWLFEVSEDTFNKFWEQRKPLTVYDGNIMVCFVDDEYTSILAVVIADFAYNERPYFIGMSNYGWNIWVNTKRHSYDISDRENYWEKEAEREKVRQEELEYKNNRDKEYEKAAEKIKPITPKEFIEKTTAAKKEIEEYYEKIKQIIK